MQQLQFWTNEQEVEVRERIWNQIDCDSQNQLMERFAQVICKAIQQPQNNPKEQEENHELE
jgi:hypothetical protein